MNSFELDREGGIELISIFNFSFLSMGIIQWNAKGLATQVTR